MTLFLGDTVLQYSTKLANMNKHSIQRSLVVRQNDDCYSTTFFERLCIYFSRVHVTQATLDYLHGEYEVEPGRGADRNSYLREHNVVSYFIVPPSHRRKVSKRF